MTFVLRPVGGLLNGGSLGLTSLQEVSTLRFPQSQDDLNVVLDGLRRCLTVQGFGCLGSSFLAARAFARAIDLDTMPTRSESS